MEENAMAEIELYKIILKQLVSEGLVSISESSDAMKMLMEVTLK